MHGLFPTCLNRNCRWKYTRKSTSNANAVFLAGAHGPPRGLIGGRLGLGPTVPWRRRAETTRCALEPSKSPTDNSPFVIVAYFSDLCLVFLVYCVSYLLSFRIIIYFQMPASGYGHLSHCPTRTSNRLKVFSNTFWFFFLRLSCLFRLIVSFRPIFPSSPDVVITNNSHQSRAALLLVSACISFFYVILYR